MILLNGTAAQTRQSNSILFGENQQHCRRLILLKEHLPVSVQRDKTKIQDGGGAEKNIQGRMNLFNKRLNSFYRVITLTLIGN